MEIGTAELRLLECLVAVKFHQLSVVLETHQHWPSFPYLLFYSCYYLVVVGGVVVDAQQFPPLGIINVNGWQNEYVAFVYAVIIVQMVQFFSGQILNSP